MSEASPRLSTIQGCPASPGVPNHHPARSNARSNDMVIEIDGHQESNDMAEEVSPEKSSTEENAEESERAETGQQLPSTSGIWTRIMQKWQCKSPYRPDERYEDFKVKRVKEYPEGYPQFAAWINTDDNFRVYRRFGELRNRGLLQYQFKLAKLEAALQKMDEDDSSSTKAEDNFRLSSIEYDQSQDDRRQSIIDDIDATLDKYDALLERERKSLLLSRPTERNHKNIINYIWNQRSIAQEEISLFNRKDDAVILVKDRDAPFHAYLEELLQNYASDSFRQLFASPFQRERSEGCDMRLFSKTRLNIFVRSVVTFVTVGLLMIPIGFLFNSNSASHIKVAVVLFFVLLFAAAISIFSQLRHYEFFAATAAYTAVLVAFLQNLSEGPDNINSG